MTLELSVMYDDLIWSPNVVSLILMKTPHEGTLQVFDGLKSNEYLESLKSIRTERQPKPIDWLITKRDEIIVQLAKKWMALDDDHSPLKFAEEIWNPLRKAWLDPGIYKETDAEHYKRVIPIEISDETKKFFPLAGGLICCLNSMESLDAGDIENTVKTLINASWYSGIFDEIVEQKDTKTPRHQDFSRLGATKRNAENRALKAQALAHYAEKGHEVGYEKKEDAAAKIAKEIVPVSARTVGKWLYGVKLGPKPNAQPE